MASIKEIHNKNGISYKIIVSLGYDVTGKKITQSTTYKPDPSLTAAQQQKALQVFATEFEQKLLNNKIPLGSKMTFYEFTNKWLSEYAANTLEASTLTSYTSYLDKHIMPQLGHYKLTQIKPMHLQSYYNNMLNTETRFDGKKGGYSAGTIKKCHAIISSILSTAYEWELIENNPCDRVRLPKQDAETKVKHFTLEQAERFLQALELEYSAEYTAHTCKQKDGSTYEVPTYTQKRSVPLQFKVFFNMALFGGFRRGELIALTWDKIDFDNNTVDISSATAYAKKTTYTKKPKTKGSIRRVTLPLSVMDMLKLWRAEQTRERFKLGEKWIESNFIFTQNNGKQMYLTTPTAVFTDLIKKYNATVPPDEQLPYIGLHGLRHTHATLLIANNTDIRTVSNRLGHANTSTTLNIYAHSLAQQDIKAANTIDEILHHKAN